LMFVYAKYDDSRNSVVDVCVS